MQQKLFLFIGLMATVLGCRKDLAGDPQFGTGDYPRIFFVGDQFPSIIIINEKDTARYNNLKFSPAGKVNIKWFVNNEVASTDSLFNFVPTTGGIFNILLEAEYKGLRSVRKSVVIVKPGTYIRKPYSKVVLGYISESGNVATVQWNHVTHVAAQYGQVNADGALDVTRGNINQRADELVARGHTLGIPVLLSVFGRLSPVDGWALYESDDLGAAIRDVSKRATLVSELANYVQQIKMDGVDIVMTDFNGSPNYGASLAALAPFVAELKKALPADALVTVSVTPGWQHWDYPDLSAADWVNVRAYEDGIHVGPAAPTGQPSSLAYLQSAAEIWKNFHLPASKIVVGFPVFGLRYLELDNDGNNLSWGSYDYVPYNGILAIDATAASKAYINSAKGIYYNGLPLITEKAAFIKQSAYKGMYGWYMDADAQDSTQSLFKAAYDQLK
jgi:Glycosyl hydrolases family 18